MVWSQNLGEEAGDAKIMLQTERKVQTPVLPVCGIRPGNCQESTISSKLSGPQWWSFLQTRPGFLCHCCMLSGSLGWAQCKGGISTRSFPAVSAIFCNFCNCVQLPQIPKFVHKFFSSLGPHRLDMEDFQPFFKCFAREHKFYFFFFCYFLAVFHFFLPKSAQFSEFWIFFQFFFLLFGAFLDFCLEMISPEKNSAFLSWDQTFLRCHFFGFKLLESVDSVSFFQFRGWMWMMAQSIHQCWEIKNRNRRYPSPLRYQFPRTWWDLLGGGGVGIGDRRQRVGKEPGLKFPTDTQTSEKKLLKKIKIFLFCIFVFYFSPPFPPSPSKAAAAVFPPPHMFASPPASDFVRLPQTFLLHLCTFVRPSCLRPRPQGFTQNATHHQVSVTLPHWLAIETQACLKRCPCLLYVFVSFFQKKNRKRTWKHNFGDCPKQRFQLFYYYIVCQIVYY